MRPFQIQISEINALRDDIAKYRTEGYEFILSDESLFNSDKYTFKHWMKSNDPIMNVKKYSDKTKINVCCVISNTFGNVYNHYGEHYFTSKDMKEVL